MMWETDGEIISFLGKEKKKLEEEVNVVSTPQDSGGGGGGTGYCPFDDGYFAEEE